MIFKHIRHVKDDKYEGDLFTVLPDEKDVVVVTVSHESYWSAITRVFQSRMYGLYGPSRWMGWYKEAEKPVVAEIFIKRVPGTIGDWLYKRTLKHELGHVVTSYHKHMLSQAEYDKITHHGLTQWRFGIPITIVDA